MTPRKPRTEPFATAEAAKTAPYTDLEEALIAQLLARHRLGEPFWSVVGTRHTTRTLEHLAQLGVVAYRPHNAAANMWYAEFTDLGREAFMDSSTYRSPLEIERDQLRAEVEGLKVALKASYQNQE